ncbi:MAG: oxalate:formate antiporter [Chloroflexi bacterium]|nr:oxalate:formate antiporter [Chloroflexota bacterium]
MQFPSSLPALHQEFIEQALPKLAKDLRIVGVAASGSYADNSLDNFSDLDLVIAVEPQMFDAIMSDRLSIAASLGNLVAGFTGEHVGEPRVLITLYGPEALHVDFKFVKVEDAATRVDEPIILWARDSRLENALSQGKGEYPKVDAQWIEDRFWVWIHYAGTKIGRGEYFEAVEFLSFVRSQVLGPLALQSAGYEARGVRKIEQLLPKFTEKLQGTVALLEKKSLLDATEHVAKIYLELRSSGISPQHKAQSLSLSYLGKLRTF